MINIVERGEDRAIKCECENCKSKLTYMLEDVVFDDNLKTIVCPVCNKKIVLK